MGPAHNVGQELAYYTLNDNAEVVIRSTVSRISDYDISPMDLCTRQSEFNDRVESIIRNIQHASIHPKIWSGTMCGIDDVYRDIFELNPYDMDELQSQIVDSDGQEATRPDAEEIKLVDAPNAEVNDG